MNLKILLFKTKSKLHAIKRPNTNKISISKNNVNKMTTVRTYAFQESNAETSEGTLQYLRGNRWHSGSLFFRAESV